MKLQTSHCVTVDEIDFFLLKTAPGMQEDYEILVIVSREDYEIIVFVY